MVNKRGPGNAGHVAIGNNERRLSCRWLVVGNSITAEGFADAKKASKETGTKMSFAPKKKKKKSAINGGYSRA